MPEPYWQNRPDDWNSIMIGADTFYIFANTKVTITGELSSKFEVKEAAETDGARQKYMGYSPAQPEITWQIYTEEHWNDWQYLFESIRPKPGRTGAVAIEAVHPQLSSAKLRKFWIQSISIPRQVGPDIFEVGVRCLEYFAQPKKSAKPKATTADISSVASAGSQNVIGPPPPPRKPSDGLKP